VVGTPQLGNHGKYGKYGGKNGKNGKYGKNGGKKGGVVILFESREYIPEPFKFSART
jgi:hypothetical protein